MSSKLGQLIAKRGLSAQSAGSTRTNLQVGKGGLPPLERQRRDWLLQLSSYSFTAQARVFSDSTVSLPGEILMILHVEILPNQSRRWRSIRAGASHPS